MHPIRSASAVRRLLAITLGLCIAGLWSPVDADAQAGGAYSGSANTDLVHVQALNIPETVQLAEAAVAPSVAEMSSAGIDGGKNSRSRAANVDVDVLSGTIAAALLVEAEHTAPGGDGKQVQNTLLEVPADPLLNATVARATAHSRWNTGGCVPVGTPIAHARSELADAHVITGTPLGDALVALNNAEGDTVYSDSTSDLVNVAGQTGKGVRSRALTQLTGITLFKGTDNQLTVNVLAPPVVEAIATGKPGTAKVTYSEPILQIVDANNEVVGELNAAEGNVEIDALPLVKLRLGHLTSDVAEDGTSATGNAVLLEVIVLESPEAIEPLARLTIAGGDVSAKAPAGGVQCGATGDTGGGATDGGNDECGEANPLRDLDIVSSSPSVVAGSTFEYVITVTNSGDCVLTDVRVEDVIDGPDGAEVVSTDPEADEVDGLTVVWNDIGPLDPGQSRTLTVTVRAPAGSDGSAFSSDVTASATGGGDRFEQTASVDGPTVGEEEVAVGGASLPVSGAPILVLLGLALALIGGGSYLRHRSNRWKPDLSA